MKVKDLIALLKKLDQEAIVLMSSDDEGNSFSYVYQVAKDREKEVIIWPGHRWN